MAGTCPYCNRAISGDICPAHGYIGAPSAKPTDLSPYLLTSDADTIVSFPLGGICLWSGAIVDIPLHYSLCDGSAGTPDLREKFVMGAGTTEVGTTGGSNADHKHSMVISATATTDEPIQAHNGSKDGTAAGYGTGYITAINDHADHHHHLSLTKDTETQTSRPAYYTLAYIQRIS